MAYPENRRNWPGRRPLFVSAVALIFLAAYAPAAQPLSCAEVAAATTRGGASLGSIPSPGGPSCTLGRYRDVGLVWVWRVNDGDTIRIAGGGRVRYIGIDAPELRYGEPYAEQALEANKHLVYGRQVSLEEDVSNRDPFGRLLRYVFVDGIFVNAELVREGYAVARAYPPDTRYQECFTTLEAEARRQGRGLWGLR